MKKIAVGLSVVLFVLAGIQSVAAETPGIRVRMETSLGDIVMMLFPDKAPKTVENFMAYVTSGFYDGTIFHRVIPGFMIQGGGLTADMEKKPTQAPVPNEADTGLKNKRGTLAMARTMDPHSATAQFFINTVDNTFLDHKEKSPQGWGYCAFGEVVEGMTVVDAISAVKTADRSGQGDVPVESVSIKKIVVE